MNVIKTRFVKWPARPMLATAIVAIVTTVATVAIGDVAGTAQAQPLHAETSAAPVATPAAPSTMGPMTADSAADMSRGEIKKVDRSAKKITIKHGEIKNLDMPGMTMVFHVQDPAMLERVKAGDKVLFRVEKSDGVLLVTELQVDG